MNDEEAVASGIALAAIEMVNTLILLLVNIGFISYDQVIELLDGVVLRREEALAKAPEDQKRSLRYARDQVAVVLEGFRREAGKPPQPPLL